MLRIRESLRQRQILENFLSNMRQLVFGLLLGWSWAACGQTAPVAERVAKQNALFEEFYQTGLKNNPERATAYGDYRYNSQLGQYSLAEIARQHAEADDFLARLKRNSEANSISKHSTTKY